MNDELYYGGGGLNQLAGTGAGPSGVGAQMATVRQRLTLAQAQAKLRVEALTRAQELLDKNPDVEELLTIMSRFSF